MTDKKINDGENDEEGIRDIENEAKKNIMDWCN